MPLDRIQLEGIKSIREMDLPLRKLNVLIGANGAGKSNFIGAFGLLGQLVDGRLQAAVARAGGAAALLHHGPKRTREMRLVLHFGKNGYEARLAPAHGGGVYFEEERCWFHGDGYEKPYDVPLRAGHSETRLLDEAKAYPGRIASHVLQTLRSWRVYHFHDTSPEAPVKQKGSVDDNAVLRPDAANLAAFLYRLRVEDEAAYRRIVSAIQQVAPFLEDFDLRPDPLSPDRMQLEWRERGSESYFNAHVMSDGTLRFACLATLLLQPHPPSLVLIDEPELGLHPFAITQLAGMLESAATRTQVLVGTQSVTLVNQLDPADIIVVDRVDGPSKFRRIEPDEIAAWADDYGLGELWEKNVLGGRPQPAPRNGPG
jgi:predicted ATPase